MGDWNLGSVADIIFDTVDNISTGVSGQMLGIIDRKRVWIQDTYGFNIGSNSIGESYQLPLLNISMAEVLNLNNIQGTDASSIKLGELTVKKGGNDNAGLTSADRLEKQALSQLQDLKGKFNYFKALG